MREARRGETAQPCGKMRSLNADPVLAPLAIAAPRLCHRKGTTRRGRLTRVAEVSEIDLVRVFVNAPRRPVAILAGPAPSPERVVRLARKGVFSRLPRGTSWCHRTASPRTDFRDCRRGGGDHAFTKRGLARSQRTVWMTGRCGACAHRAATDDADGHGHEESHVTTTPQRAGGAPAGSATSGAERLTDRTRGRCDHDEIVERGRLGSTARAGIRRRLLLDIQDCLQTCHVLPMRGRQRVTAMGFQLLRGRHAADGGPGDHPAGV